MLKPKLLLQFEGAAPAKTFLADLKDFHSIEARSPTPKTKLDEFWKLETAGHLLVSEFPSNLVCEYWHGKMGLPSGLQAGRQWRGRVRHLLALAVGQVRGEPEPFVPVS